jgi:hypothetical protein
LVYLKSATNPIVRDLTLIFPTRRINMKQDARKNLQRRRRNKKRLAMKKYIAEKKSKGLVA